MQKQNGRLSAKSRWLLLAAVAAVPVLASQSAHAQYQVNDGRARDASNRVGSNGINDGGGARGPLVTGNQIVTGNVTRGQRFQGPIGYTDPFAFRGPTSGFNSDRFIRDSSGAAVRGAPNLNTTYAPQAFYGQSRAVAPPAGTISLGTSGGYVAPTQGQLEYTIIKSQQFANPWAFSALGATNPAFSGSAANLGTSYLQTSVDGQSRDGRRFVLNPLSGIRAIPTSPTGDFSVSADGTVTRGNGMSIQEMRSELLGNATNNTGTSGSGLPAVPGSSQTTPGATQLPGATPIPGASRLQGTVTTPAPSRTGTDAGQTPNPSALSPGALDNSVGSSPALSGNISGAGVRRDLPTPAQQSRQYNELRERFEKARGREMSDQEAMQQLKAQNRARGVEPPPSGLPTGGTAPRTNPPAVPLTPAPGGVAASPATPPGPPVEIKSLAAGVQAKGLATVLKSAEELVKQGKFAAALDEYDTAEQVAPNNPLILLGKANAELGASSYRSAEAHIRQAFGTDPALLMGKYDLRTFIGDERLRVLITDLADLSKANPDEVTAPFLLSYIFYNTGNAPLASSWLNDAERRAGQPDQVIQSMRKNWALTPAAPANK